MSELDRQRAAAPNAASSAPSLEMVRHIRVPGAVADEVQQWLRLAGQQSCEGVGFWAGTQEDETFDVRAAYIPRQLAGRSDDGVMVMIPGDELFRMNVWLHQQRLTLIAQVHSHPGRAYHSETDDDFAVMSRVGGLSIVVPDYARRPFSLAFAAVYRLREMGRWVPLRAREVAALIVITP